MKSMGWALREISRAISGVSKPTESERRIAEILGDAGLDVSYKYESDEIVYVGKDFLDPGHRELLRNKILDTDMTVLEDRHSAADYAEEQLQSNVDAMCDQGIVDEIYAQFHDCGSCNEDGGPWQDAEVGEEDRTQPLAEIMKNYRQTSDGGGLACE